MSSIPSSEDVKQFLKTLVLGEFEESSQQSNTAVFVRGLVGIIPGIDQILDAQDTIGLIYRFKQKNWQLDKEDYADAAFTAFGWVPEIGSVFKGVLKPLWRSSRSGSVGVRNGIAALERGLGKKHGAFISKIRTYVNSGTKWAEATTIAVAGAQKAIDAYLQMLNVIAGGSIKLRPVAGWEWTHFSISLPDSLIQLAKSQIAPTQRFRQIMADAIRQGSETVREFLQELLGEHAEVVTAAIAGSIGHTGRGRSNRGNAVPVAGRNADGKRRNNPEAVRQTPHPTLGNGQTAQNAGTNRGRVVGAVQKTGGLIGNALTGIIGEHMADYWMLRQLGGTNARHDHGHDSKAQSQSGCYKMNYGGKLYQLHIPSVNAKGIDSLWKVDGKVGGKPYCIVEAKASAQSLTKSLGALLTDGRDKTERRTAGRQEQLQMSHKWCRNKLRGLMVFNIVGAKYSRRVVFFNAVAIKDHLAAYSEALQYSTDSSKYNELTAAMHKHQAHEPTKVFTDTEIDAWVRTRTTPNSSQKTGKSTKKR